MFRFSGVKIVKSNKIEKNWRTDNKISGSKMP